MELEQRLRPTGGLRIRNSFLAFARRHQLLQSGQRVLLAVSGGRDSMMLLSLMHRVGEWDLAVAHCNFQLRGEEADADQALVERTCGELGVECHTIRFATEEWAASHGASIQEACRSLRYEWFDRLCSEAGYTAVVTAHHALDQAETVLMNLFRGTGLEGLKGIPLRNGRVVRPLLGLSRADIEQWVEELGVEYRDDASNSSDKYTRNFVRHHTMPSAVEVNARAVEHICQTATLAREGMETLRAEAEARWGALEMGAREELRVELESEEWRAHEGLGWFWLRELLGGIGFAPVLITQLREMVEAGSQTGRSVSQGEWCITLNRGALDIARKGVGEVRETYVEAGSRGRLCLAYEECVGWERPFVMRGDGVAVLDAGAVDFPLILRSWRAGDRFAPLGMGGRTKRVSDFLTDRKVSGVARERVLVLESGGRIVWVVGYAVDNAFALRRESSRALVVQLLPEGS